MDARFPTWGTGLFLVLHNAAVYLCLASDSGIYSLGPWAYGKMSLRTLLYLAPLSYPLSNTEEKQTRPKKRCKHQSTMVASATKRALRGGIEVTGGALRLLQGMESSTVTGPKVDLVQIGNAFYLECNHLLDSGDLRLQDSGNRPLPRVSGFLVGMAATSLALEVGSSVLGKMLLSWFNVAIDPLALAVAHHSVLMVLGIGVVCYLWRHAPDTAQRRHMFLTPILAMGVGLILVGLGRLVGQTGALDGLVGLVYLLWAWVSALSAV